MDPYGIDLRYGSSKFNASRLSLFNVISRKKIPLILRRDVEFASSNQEPGLSGFAHWNTTNTFISIFLTFSFLFFMVMTVMMATFLTVVKLMSKAMVMTMLIMYCNNDSENDIDDDYDDGQ